MRPIEQRVLDAVDVDGMLEYLCEIVAVPSLSNHESAAQEQLRLLLDNMPAMNYDHVFSRARWVGDDAGGDVRALVIRKSVLMKGE